MVSKGTYRHQDATEVRSAVTSKPCSASGDVAHGEEALAHEITLTSSTSDVRRALIDLHCHLQSTGTSPDLCETAQIALAEVLNNIVEHAYRFEEGHGITLRVIKQTTGLRCETRDQGLAMPGGEPPKGAMPEFDPDAIMDLAEGGFGWAMVRALTHDMGYRRDGSVNRLWFCIPAPSAELVPST